MEQLAYRSMEKEDWDTFEKIVLSNSHAMKIAFDHLFKNIPNDRKYKLILGAYSWGGASKKNIQKAVKSLPKYGKPELPDDFDDVITVYRGCTGSAENAASSFSWTTSLEAVKFFRRVHETGDGQAARIFRGKIRKEDIVAYITDLGQYEVIQFGKVFEVEDITDQVHDAIYEERRNEVSA